jgi:DNA topoisomerase VI subunit A
MMTDEELQEARGFEHCHEYDNCKADGIIENLLAYIDEQASQIAYWQKCYNDLVELNVKEEGACKLALDAKDRQIAALKAICTKERFWQIWKAGECQTVKKATAKAEHQLAQEYPEIAWKEMK